MMKATLESLARGLVRGLAPETPWTLTIKRTIARFARGNISAQNGRILLPEEQEEEGKKMRAISVKWKARYKP